VTLQIRSACEASGPEAQDRPRAAPSVRTCFTKPNRPSSGTRTGQRARCCNQHWTRTLANLWQTLLGARPGEALCLVELAREARPVGSRRRTSTRSTGSPSRRSWAAERAGCRRVQITVADHWHRKVAQHSRRWYLLALARVFTVDQHPTPGEPHVVASFASAGGRRAGRAGYDSTSRRRSGGMAASRAMRAYSLLST
jgi:hypothetical protein